MGWALAATVAAAVSFACLGVATPSARAEPDDEDVRAAEEELRELEARHQRAVEEYLQAQTRLERLDGDIDDTADRVDTLAAKSDAREGDAAQVIRRLYTGRSAASAVSLLDTTDVVEAGRRAAYLEFAERGHREALEAYRHARIELDHEARALRTARTEATELREELAARAERIDDDAAEQQTRVASLRQQVAERRERERAERAAAERAEQAASEEAEAQRVAAEAEQAAEDTAEDTTEDTVADAAAPEGEQVAGRDGPPAASRSGREDAGGGGTSSPPTAPGAGGAVDAAMSKRGSPYQWGAQGPNRFDCSGLTMWAWSQAGVSIPRTSQAQYNGLPHVSRSELQPGDLVFFGQPIHHVAMYIGGGQMVEAPYSGQSVRVRSMDRPDYVGAARPGG